MPVDLRTHDPSDDVHIDSSEIHDRLNDIPKGSVTGTLTRLLNEGDIGKTADSYYHALESRDDLRRFARGLVQIQDLTERYDDDFTSADIEQTGENPTSGAYSGTGHNSSATEKPAPEDWIESTDDASRTNDSV
ncbi:hypothetical protein [Natrialba taiwanensis]|uniref:PaaX domain-containing protein n=1 Tax=Natrialba taiwanensis DSM 12281 TaxID=1230458 RepID=L9ZKQ5_9EURY|nr:hypothetical protein [Natrialba taiwanensis]ELY86137.1 PaaX domain-containing protein [Natrialba taiwanensis DSM 12281]